MSSLIDTDDPNWKNSFDLLVGKVQSGKTGLILNYAHSLITKGYIPIIIVRPNNVDAEQILKRISIFNQNIESEINPILIKKKPDILKNNLIISLGTAAQMIACQRFMIENRDKKFCLIIDEVDLYAGSSTKSEKILEQISAMKKEETEIIYHILGVTATPMAILFGLEEDKTELIVNRVFELPTPPDYVNLTNTDRLKHIPVESIKGWARTRDTTDEERDQKELEVIGQMLGNCQETREYCISLILSANEKDNQSGLTDKVIKTYPEWVGIVFNGNGVEIIFTDITNPSHNTSVMLHKDCIIKHTSMSGRIKYFLDITNPHKNKKRVLMNVDGSVNEPVKLNRDYEIIELGALPSALRYLKLMNKKKIVIVAGKLGDRGISFVDEDYDSSSFPYEERYQNNNSKPYIEYKTKLPYHLTDLYIRSEIKKDKKGNVKLIVSHCEKIIQKLRILGRYKDTNELYLWTTQELYDEIFNCYKQIEDYTKKLVEITNKKSVETWGEWKSILAAIITKKSEAPVKITKSRIQKKQLASSNLYEKKINNSKLYGNDLHIRYCNNTKGWCRLEEGYSVEDKKSKHFEMIDRPKDYMCNYNDCKKAEQERDFILNQLDKLYPTSNILTRPLKQITYYIPNIPISSKSGVETRTKQYSPKNYRDDALDFKEKLYKDPKFIEYIKKNTDIFKQGIDINTLIKPRSFMAKSIDIHYSNNQNFIYKEDNHRILIDDNGNYDTSKNDNSLPNRFMYGTKDTLDNQLCPVLIDINFVNDFYVNTDDGKKLIKSNINDGDIIWWQNLYGTVFVDFKEPHQILKNIYDDSLETEENTIHIDLKTRKRKPQPSDSSLLLPPKLLKSREGFINANPLIKDLFNKEILPKIIRMYLSNSDKKLDFIYLDNKLNTTNSILEVLTPPEIERINFIIIEYNPEETRDQRIEITKLLEINDNIKIKILEGDLKDTIKTIKSDNKFIYADTCGSEEDLESHPYKGSWPIYHRQLVEISRSDIVIGTYSLHDSHPYSYLGRESEKYKTITYEYGVKTIMKTYISINLDMYRNWKQEYISGPIPKEDFDREDILEFKIPEYKQIEEINDSQRVIPEPKKSKKKMVIKIKSKITGDNRSNKKNKRYLLTKYYL
jgi:hypothetical protein